MYSGVREGVLRSLMKAGNQSEDMQQLCSKLRHAAGIGDIPVTISVSERCSLHLSYAINAVTCFCFAHQRETGKSSQKSSTNQS